LEIDGRGYLEILTNGKTSENLINDETKFLIQSSIPILISVKNKELQFELQEREGKTTN
jgi:hypothetical protein